jgi:starch synthase
MAIVDGGRRVWIAKDCRDALMRLATGLPSKPPDAAQPMAQVECYKVLLAASEVVGFAKTGGLADVAGSLPRALARRGHDCAVMMPLYRGARHGRLPVQPTDLRFHVPIGDRQVTGRLWRSTLPGSEVPVYLIEQPDYFDRDDPTLGRGLYQFTTTTGERRDYPDNCERFIFFTRAVLEAIRLLDFWPDVVHANDWQTGLLPVYLKEEYARRPAPVNRPWYRSIRSLFTIHNIAYQGIFWQWDMKLAGLDWRLFNPDQLEFYGNLNFLKGGIVFSDLINTVSPTYAREIQTPYYGCGLQGVLMARSDRLFGIVNGVDYTEWNPATDRHLPATYDADSVVERKPQCKAALQRRLHLAEEPHAPLLGMVARLAEQKGIDLVGRAADVLLRQGAQLVLLGDGDQGYQQMLQKLRARFPDRVGLHLGFDEALAHQIEAGADLFLMPSLYEPSGLNQLYSMKYGTPPVVRATGGLADTVTDTTPASLAEGAATGFCFVPYSPEALLETVTRAVELYRREPESWWNVVRNGMCQDWSWDRSAAEYEALYRKLVGERGA